MPGIETFVVPAEGIGSRDYSKTVERSTSPFVTPSLRQMWISGTGRWSIPTTPYPVTKVWGITMPQDDGTWGWVAGSIIVHWFESHVYLETNHLCTVGLVRYANYAALLAGIITERYPQIFGYGRASILYSRGIPTQPGCCYGLLAGGWPDTPTYEVNIGMSGIVTELTRPWIQFAP